MDYPGKVITKNQVTPTQTSATGVWTLDDAAAAVKNNNWPVAGVPNPISKSLRLNSVDSAFLNRTPASAGNRKTWTWSGWIKRSGFSGSTIGLFGAGTSGTNYCYFGFQSGNTLNFQNNASSGNQINTTTAMVFRDVSAWYHIVLAVDTTQATNSNGVKLYVNGVQQTLTFSAYTQNTDTLINDTNAHVIGDYISGGGLYFPGYLTEVNFIDGQALTPSSFGMTDPQTGAWEPIRYTGTYGTNGFYLNFKDATNTTTLGYDYSGNANNWTTNNFSVTAGSGNDSLTDVPTPWIAYNTTGDVGGVVRGNYCTLNPLDGLNTAGALLGVFSNGNLDYSVSGSAGNAPRMLAFSTIYFPSSGKWYAEFSNISNRSVGIISGSVNQAGVPLTKYITVTSGGRDFNDGSITSGGATSFTTSDVIGVAYDIDNATLKFYKNGTEFIAFGSVTTSVAYCFGSHHQSSSSSGTFLANFGQRPFANTPPAGFLSLCTTNLPNPTIGTSTTTQAGKYFNTVLLSGNGSAGSVTGVGFQPDFIWAKNRTNAYNHELWDAIRGVNSTLFSNSTAAEDTTANRLVSFNSDGFSYGTSSNLYVNATNSVAWNWKANGSGSSNTQGTITSTVSASTTAGFSIVSAAGQNNTSTLTIGHGLGVAPKMLIGKSRNGTGGWSVWHTTLATNELVYLNSTAAKSVDGGTPPAAFTATSSTTFTVQNWNRMIGSGVDGIFYAFAEVAGYSAFGSYTGNGSTDGPFVYTGFRPRFVMFKRTDTAEGWYIYDTVRTTINVMGAELRAESSAAESDFSSRDFLSNGFKIRTANGSVNASGGTYIFAAFAESPFKYSLAR